MKKTLKLRKETLSELTREELVEVAAGGGTRTCHSCLDYISCWCLTIEPACWRIEPD